MNEVKKWIADHNVSSHSISAAVLAFVTLYLSNDAVKQLVDGFLAQHKTMAAVFSAVVAISLKYSGSHSTQGAVNVIANTPKAEVATAIIAVKAANAPATPAQPELQNVVAAAAATDPPKVNQ